MAPSLRRRGQPSSAEFSQTVSDDSEEFGEEEELDDEQEDQLPDEDDGMDDDEEEEGEEDDEEAQASPPRSPAITHFPIPPHYREISTLASWTVSSSKPGCSIPQLRSPSTSLFWQSDGPQPHYLNIHFFKLVRIVGLRLYLDFESDESYTPTRIIFLAGSGNNDLVEWGEMRLEQPRGWVWADFSGVGETEEDDGDSGDEENEGEEEDGAQTDVPDILRDNADLEIENTQPTQLQAPGRDAMLLDQNNQHQQQQTPIPTTAATPLTTTHPHPAQNTSPTLTRANPRRPLHNLTPTNASPNNAPPRAKKSRTPVLRAHLVQIKILENHQNGKDTHLRGLQIFARDNEGREPVAREVHVGQGGRGKGRLSGGGGGGGEFGGGFRGMSKSAWDVEPSIR